MCVRVWVLRVRRCRCEVINFPESAQVEEGRRSGGGLRGARCVRRTIRTRRRARTCQRMTVPETSVLNCKFASLFTGGNSKAAKGSSRGAQI
jgi:predicted phage-related endonuclease